MNWILFQFGSFCAPLSSSHSLLKKCALHLHIKEKALVVVEGRRRFWSEGPNENLLLSASEDFSVFLVNSSYRDVFLLQLHLNFKCTSMKERTEEQN